MKCLASSPKYTPSFSQPLKRTLRNQFQQLSTVSNIHLFSCADKTLSEPGKELSPEDHSRCEKITDKLFEEFDKDNNGVIDGLEVKKALEDMVGEEEKRKWRLNVRDGLVAWLSKMSENYRNFSEEVTGDGSPFARIEVVKATL